MVQCHRWRDTTGGTSAATSSPSYFHSCQILFQHFPFPKIIFLSSPAMVKTPQIMTFTSGANRFPPVKTTRANLPNFIIILTNKNCVVGEAGRIDNNEQRFESEGGKSPPLIGFQLPSLRALLLPTLVWIFKTPAGVYCSRNTQVGPRRCLATFAPFSWRPQVELHEDLQRSMTMS